MEALYVLNSVVLWYCLFKCIVQVITGTTPFGLPPILKGWDNDRKDKA
jgi:hypothetical protein